jgi:hypothetical protein
VPSRAAATAYAFQHDLIAPTRWPVFSDVL